MVEDPKATTLTPEKPTAPAAATTLEKASTPAPVLEHPVVKHQATTFQFGDVVFYVKGGKFQGMAQVLQSTVHPTHDPKAAGGVRYDELLLLLCLKPGAGKAVMSGTDVDQSIQQLHSVPEYSEANSTGWIRARIEPAQESYRVGVVGA